MRLKYPLAVGLAAVVATASACTPSDPSIAQRWAAPSVSPPAAVTPTLPHKATTDYSRLLLRAEDLSILPETYSTRSSAPNPEGQSGTSALFVNADDTRAIADTVLVYPDAATASATLKQATAAINTMVSGGTPHPVPIGTDGTVISGTAPDDSKAVTLLMFTEGRALVRLEFDSAHDDPTPPQVVTSVGKMQQIALRTGLPDQT